MSTNHASTPGITKRDRLEGLKRAWYKFSLNKMSIVGLVIVSLILILGVFQPLIAPYPEHAGAYVNFSAANQPPSSQYILGTDTVGRDILSRIFYAFRGALLMGLGVEAFIIPLGTIVGLIAGYWKEKWFSTALMRVTDIFLAVPPLVLALVVSALMRPTLFNLMMAVRVAWWPMYARMIYGMTSSIRNAPFVKCSELLAASKFHILFREILPNCLGQIFTKMTLDMGWVILMGASLSFVGLGEQPPTPALGTMVSDGAKYLPDQWWIAIFPSIAIMVIILGFNFLGDGVKDMLTSEE